MAENETLIVLLVRLIEQLEQLNQKLPYWNNIVINANANSEDDARMFAQMIHKEIIAESERD
jgi:hypothetical protein